MTFWTMKHLRRRIRQVKGKRLRRSLYELCDEAEKFDRRIGRVEREKTRMLLQIAQVVQDAEKRRR